MGGVRRPFYYIDSIIYHLKKIVNVLLWKKYIECYVPCAIFHVQYATERKLGVRSEE